RVDHEDPEQDHDRRDHHVRHHRVRVALLVRCDHVVVSRPPPSHLSPLLGAAPGCGARDGLRTPGWGGVGAQSPSPARLAGRSSRAMIGSIVASASASASAGATSPIIDCWIASPMATLTSQGYSGSPIVYGTTSSVMTSDQGASAAPGSAFTASATSSRAGALVNCVSTKNGSSTSVSPARA